MDASAEPRKRPLQIVGKLQDVSHSTCKDLLTVRWRLKKNNFSIFFVSESGA